MWQIPWSRVDQACVVCTSLSVRSKSPRLWLVYKIIYWWLAWLWGAVELKRNYWGAIAPKAPMILMPMLYMPTAQGHSYVYFPQLWATDVTLNCLHTSPFHLFRFHFNSITAPLSLQAWNAGIEIEGMNTEVWIVKQQQVCTCMYICSLASKEPTCRHSLYCWPLASQYLHYWGSVADLIQSIGILTRQESIPSLTLASCNNLWLH